VCATICRSDANICVCVGEMERNSDCFALLLIGSIDSMIMDSEKTSERRSIRMGLYSFVS
jgi:hypothetical protein